MPHMPRCHMMRRGYREREKARKEAEASLAADLKADDKDATGSPEASSSTGRNKRVYHKRQLRLRS